MLRVACATVLALLACSAKAVWYPVFSPSFVQLRPGESSTIVVRGVWSGIFMEPFRPMTFEADNPNVAIIAGSLPTTLPETLYIRALQPGVTRVRVMDSTGSPAFPTSPIIVVADRTLAVRVETDDPLIVGRSITLRAVSDEPDSQFIWYTGRLADILAWQVGRGPTMTVMPTVAIVHEYWVIMTAPRGAGLAAVALDIKQPTPSRRRATGH